MVEFDHAKKKKKGKRANCSKAVPPYPFPAPRAAKRARMGMEVEIREEIVEVEGMDGAVMAVKIPMPNTTLDAMLLPDPLEDFEEEPVLLPRMLRVSKFPVNLKADGGLYFGKRRGRPTTDKLEINLSRSLRKGLDWKMDLDTAPVAKLKELVLTGRALLAQFETDMIDSN